MRKPVVHVIGAGLGGLSAATALAGGPFDIVVHEAARQAGGRCRSYFDEPLGMTIDNGNHLLLSGNRSALAYLDAIGARAEMRGPGRCAIDFVDAATGERWVLAPNEGPLPWWLLFASRRVPGTSAAEYLPAGRLLVAAPDAAIGEVLKCAGTLYERLWEPFLVAALNSDPVGAAAALAASTLRETLARGGRACHPLVAANGLSRAFIDPALKLLRRAGAQIRFERRLRGLELAEDRVVALEFEHDSITLEPDDRVVLAVPAHVATGLVPGLSAPLAFNAILNAHFEVAPPPGTPEILGVVHATTQWIFAYPDRLSVTVSDANRFMDAPREKLAAELWREVAALTGLSDDLPSWRIIKERRATFAATPEQNARRPATRTAWRNLVLAGDYVQTGLPATIEGAVRSGHAAARAASALAVD
jgi:squalene-associated FAD-dependent desaturase